MSTIVDIADAVVASLNGGTFSQAFAAERFRGCGRRLLL